MNIADIASICHAANAELCRSIGDNSQPEWDAASDWQKDSACNGVRFHLDNPAAGPDADHNNWLLQKRDEGWKYGTIKDPDKKTHPCFLPFDKLPAEQQAKDYLFRAIVHALKPFMSG